jgi:hypothetical protein
VIVIKFGRDYGGGSDKFTFSLVDTPGPCSSFLVAVLTYLEGDKKDVGIMPGGTHRNYSWVLERVDG